VAEHQAFEHLFFGQLIPEPFDHQDRLIRAGQNEVERAGFELFLPRHEDELFVDESDANAGEGPLEGDGGGEGESRAGADNGQHVGVIFAVAGQDVPHDLDFVGVTLGEEGADGAIDEAAGEDFFKSGTAFALEETAGELARRRRPFAIIDRQRKKIDARAGGAVLGSDKDDCFTVLYDDGAAGLLRPFSGC
jgi:hypothetical protein